jgi:hypothetical protein
MKINFQSPLRMRVLLVQGLFLGLIQIFSSCSAIDIFKENTEIPAAKTYKSFVIINREVNVRGFVDPAIDDLVSIQIEDQLTRAGMVYDSKRPDLVIRYRSNEDLRQREIVQNMNPYPFWGYRIYDPWMFNQFNNPWNRRVTTDNYELIQVIVDFIDPEKDKFLMTLTGVTEVSSPKYKAKKVEKTLSKVLETFVTQSNPN